MKIESQHTVGEIAAKDPRALDLFERTGIDYCCRGALRLDEACRQAGADLADILAALHAIEPSGPAAASFTDWRAEPIADLLGHIEREHHTYTRSALQTCGQLARKVLAAHGERHTELREIVAVFDALADELDGHLLKEERVLFPYIAALDVADASGGRAPFAPFGSVQNPVRMMSFEHDSAGDALKELRSHTRGYTLPDDACASYRAFYEALHALERDLHVHIHLESNVLFPRAIALEARLARRT